MTLTALFHRFSYAFAALLCLILLVINLIVSPHFAAPAQWATTLGTLAPFVIVGFASTPAILAGGIDISVGPLATLINCIFVALLFPAGLGDWQFSVPILLALATGIGALNGFLVTVVRLHPAVVTTGMLFLLIGLSLTISPRPLSAPKSWVDSLAGSVWIIPGAVLTIGVPAVLWFVLRRTAFVSNLLATGESDVSAYGSGVNVTMTRFLAYTLGGLFAGIGGIALTALLRSSEPTIAGTYVVLGLAAAALGGASFGGGRGGLLGTFFGALALYLVQQLLTAAGVRPSLIQFFFGLVLIVGVLLGATLLSPRFSRSLS